MPDSPKYAINIHNRGLKDCTRLMDIIWDFVRKAKKLPVIDVNSNYTMTDLTCEVMLTFKPSQQLLDFVSAIRTFEFYETF